MIAAVFVAGSLCASPDVVANLRLYEGVKKDSPPSEEVVSSYHVKSQAQASFATGATVEKEKNSLRKVFSLVDVNLITKAALSLREGVKDLAVHTVMLNGRKLLISLSNAPGEKDKFKVKIESFKKDMNPKPLLESSLHLPQSHVTVLGFEDSAGKNYFLAFHRGKNVPAPPAPPVPPKDIKKIPEINKPRLIKSIQPKYPKEAIKAGISGTVVIDAVTDVYGRVMKAEVISGHSMLKGPALAALKQWVYEPYILDGKPCPVKFTVVIKFNLNKDKHKKPVNLSAEQRPRLLKSPSPAYPEAALKSKLDGDVVLEAVTDTRGNVIEVTWVDGHTMLADAAKAALKQWKYEPYYIDGKPHPVRFTVVVKFRLNKDKKDKEKIKMLSAKQKPKLIRRVNPKYPKAALKARIGGKVVIEATTDTVGVVVNAVVVEGPEELREASLRAVKQWVYEPYIIDGKPAPVKFTVVMKFNLDKKKEKSKEKSKK